MLRSIVDFSKKDDEIADMYFIINFKDDEILSEIKLRSELKVRGSLTKKHFKSIKKLNKFCILIKILRQYGLKLEVR